MFFQSAAVSFLTTVTDIGWFPKKETFFCLILNAVQMTRRAKSAKFISTVGRGTKLFYGTVKAETTVVKGMAGASYFFKLDMVSDFFRNRGTILV